MSKYLDFIKNYNGKQVVEHFNFYHIHEYSYDHIRQYRLHSSTYPFIPFKFNVLFDLKRSCSLLTAMG